MNRHYVPGSDEWRELFATFDSYAWRLETLQNYAGSGEDERMARFNRGEPYQPTQAKQRWLDIITGAHARGASIGRVHVVAEPLTDYMRFELSWGYAPNVDAGEDIRIIPVPETTVLPPELERRQDFWLFDDRLYLMHYAHDGTWLDVEHVDDERQVAAALTARRLALDMAMPYQQYMRRHPDLLERAAA